MNVFQSILLGIVQGATEFLPVSSSGHLILMRKLFGIEGGSLMYDLLLHAGTLAAVLVCFRKDVLNLFLKPKKLLLLILATIPAAVLGVLFADKIDAIFNEGEYLFIAFGVTAVLLIVGERVAKKMESTKSIGVKQSITMGLMQGVALIPGISRSGSTIFGGLVSGSDRNEVASFAFLMSLPIIAGGIVLGLTGMSEGEAMTLNVGWWETLCGVAAAFVSGIFAMGVVDKVVKKVKFKPFVFYLFGLSVLSFVLNFV